MGFGDILVSEEEHSRRAKESTELSLREHDLRLILVYDLHTTERTQYRLRRLCHFTPKAVIIGSFVIHVYHWHIEDLL